MNLIEDDLKEPEDNLTEEELDKLIEEEIKLEKEILTTLTVGAILGYIFFFE